MATSPGESAMRLIDLKDLTPEQLKTFSESHELSPDEKAEVARLYWAQVTTADLQEYADWPNATPVDDFLRELKEEQRQWDEQNP